MRGFIMLAGAAFLSGCAAMSKDECLYADWNAVGYEDGAAGKPVSAVSSRRAACAKKAGVTLDFAAYSAGREQGLRVFCEPSNGYALGARGGAYYGVCTGASEDEFLTAFEAGSHLYDLERGVASIEAQLRQAQYDLRGLEHDIAATETALVSTGPTYAERLELLKELKLLSEDKGNIETAIIALNRDYVRAQTDLEEYRNHIAYNDAYPRGATGTSPVNY